MAERDPYVSIKAVVTIEGPAEEILARVRNLKTGERAVSIEATLPRRGGRGIDFHTLPIIKNGETQTAIEQLERLHRQTIVDEDTDRRLENLIIEFGRFTE
ncbi:MAG: hypothetical protein WD767_17130 [Alphaproteobacteria bacterium]